MVSVHVPVISGGILITDPGVYYNKYSIFKFYLMTNKSTFPLKKCSFRFKLPVDYCQHGQSKQV